MNIKLIIQIFIGIMLSFIVIVIISAAYQNYIFEQKIAFLLGENTLEVQRAQEMINARIKDAGLRTSEQIQQLLPKNHNTTKELNNLRIEQIKQEEVEAKKRYSKLWNSEYKRKQIEWNNYYIVPNNCESFDSDAQMVECINHKMRAKKEFEKIFESKVDLSMNKQFIQ